MSFLKFPSPTGVTYYELEEIEAKRNGLDGFRPQQGLLIMNRSKKMRTIKICRVSVPNRGYLL